MKTRTIRAMRGGDVMEFPTITRCAAHFGFSTSSLRKAMELEQLYGGWFFEDAETGRGYIPDGVEELKGQRNRKAVIGINPQGRCVRFVDSLEASRCTGIVRASIAQAIERGQRAGSWNFIYDDGRVCEPFTEELKATVLVKAGAKKRDYTSAVGRGVKFNAVRREDSGDETIAYGYYDQEFAPCVCPVCGMVVGIDAKAHLSRCLSGRDYSLDVTGVIRLRAGVSRGRGEIGLQ